MKKINTFEKEGWFFRRFNKHSTITIKKARNCSPALDVFTTE